MKTLHNNYCNSKQGYLPLFLSDCLDLLDPVLTFDRLMGGIDLNKYLTGIPEYTTGRLRYNPVNILKTVLFGFMTSGYCSLRELEDNCKVNIRFMYLMEHQTPSYRTFGYFINEILQDNIENIFMAIVAAIPLLYKACASQSGKPKLLTLSIFIVSMILLYAASTVYHTFDISKKINTLLKKIDHMMIFVLIAGTYTPVCLLVIGGFQGKLLLFLVWGIALVGMCINALWIYCPKIFSSAIYIGLGWLCVFMIAKIIKALPTTGLVWLLAGGIIYTIGGVIYALKLKAFNSLSKNFGSHEVFHLFVMAGSFCHYMLMYSYLA